MKEKLNPILLIDDNEADNFIHKVIINDVGCAKDVTAFQDAKKALDYLRKISSENHLRPSIIFLDINMPGMDGWEFLEEYQKLQSQEKGEIVVVMLTTSPNPDDKLKALNIPVVNEFVNKPLSEELLEDIIERYFPKKL